MDKAKIRSFTLLMALGTFVVVLDNTIMNVSIQALVQDLKTTVSGVQGAIALNALTMAAFVLFGGKLADIIGMKKTFMVGVMLYIAGSLTASFSTNLSVFILGWCVIQGFGAALMLPNVQTIIRAVLSGEARAKAYGAMAGVNALGAAMGPIIGGFLTTYFSWRWAFRLEVLALLLVILFNALIPKDKIAKKARAGVDTIGVILQAGAMVSIVLGILLISDYGLLLAKEPLVIGGTELDLLNLGLSPVIWLLGLGILLLLLFIRVETSNVKTQKPSLIRLTLFTIKDFVNGLKVRSIQVSIIAGILFTVPLFMQVSFGISAFATGLALLPLSISLVIGAALGVRLGKNKLPKFVVQLGSLSVVIGALLLVIGVNTATKPFNLVFGLTILGIGSGLIGSQIVNLILSSVTPSETAEASGATSTLEQVGNSVGVAILGTLLTVSLSLGLTQSLAKNTTIPSEIKSQAQAKIERGVEIVSDEAVQKSVSGLDPKMAEAVLSSYDTARTNAFRITMFAVAFFGLLMLIMSRDLPTKKLIE